MPRVLACICVLSFPLLAAADFGIGASFQSDQAGVHVPIRITERILLEPFIRHSNLESEVSSEDTTFPPGTTSIEGLDVGTGLFGSFDVAPNMSFYIGARAAYVYEKFESDSLIISSIPLQGLQPPRQKSELDGFTIAPGLGFQYFIIDRVSLGAEVSWEYTDVSGFVNTIDTSGNQTRLDTESRRTGTRTDVVLRFYFP